MRLEIGLQRSLKFHTIATELNMETNDLIVTLYLLAGWFRQQGKYGVMKHPLSIIDIFTGCEGLAKAMVNVGWLQETSHGLMLKEFTDVSGIRKGISKAIRARLFAQANGKCAACGGSEKLVIDHKVPVSRGGDCEEDNLQILCTACNVAKGTKTMEEWEACK